MKIEYSTRKKIRLENYDYSGNGMYFITICTKDKIPYLSEIVRADNINAQNVNDTDRSVGADIIRPQIRPQIRTQNLKKTNDIIRPIVNLTEIGKIAEESINQISEHYQDVRAIKYCIMPDHIHLIIEIMHDFINADKERMMSENNGRIISAPTIPVIVGSFKRYVSKKSGINIWQRSYYDHIIRNKQEFLEICGYIENNPLNWINNNFNINKWR